MCFYYRGSHIIHISAAGDVDVIVEVQVGGRVQREYVGGGLAGALAADLDARDRAKAHENAQTWAENCARWEAAAELTARLSALAASTRRESAGGERRVTDFLDVEFLGAARRAQRHPVAFAGLEQGACHR